MCQSEEVCGCVLSEGVYFVKWCVDVYLVKRCVLSEEVCGCVLVKRCVDVT